jgi:uncharacterized protein YjiS (DUF1127 family)
VSGARGRAIVEASVSAISEQEDDMSGYLTSQMLDPAWRRPTADDGGGRFRQWMAEAIRRRLRRKTIQALNDLDDWTLADIGFRRADIPRVVEELNARELRMRPPSRRRDRDG